MAVTDQTLGNEIQFTLLETPNNGGSYGSGLYTLAEVSSRLNFRANLFNMLTNTFVNYGERTVTNNSKAQDLSGTFGDLIDIINVSYSNTGPLQQGTYQVIPSGSSAEFDMFTHASVDPVVPDLWAIDTAAPLQLNFFPAPTYTSPDATMLVLYVPKLGNFPAVPNGTAFPSGFPDDLTPFIKYGVLADLFSKSGETYDPIRASICEGLFTLGAELARSWISGSTEEPISVKQPFVAPISG